ncbi:NAD(P)/FAD-dependent oxidoreductase [Dietzia sp. PP-33]|jgi:cation diffusion facilitator CzcD-associated flavoprotein CzcO|uniref:flavin-containing monooxygenase n=1 Tax=Dietzia sp. PP-33 TaxID=2957500 RepID=UPI0029A15905|nr:NAD(P)/FAD-dependent oxidoreductase [Dietzia sp. PP-33]MDX2358456.1 NAD(P)/FAD-dependent oxidoreductase [Dietzia sp. PP-33]
MAFTLPESNIPLDIDFDPEYLRQRFEADKQARLRKDQLDQFQGLADVLEVDDRDPFTEPINREAVIEELDTLVLGGGFGGLTAGAYLTRNEVKNFRIVEYGGDFGGTWYWNRYPGVQCDIESHIYLPLLEETGYVPSQRYADGSEIFEHAQRIGRHYDLYDRTYFQTRATHAQWDENAQRWDVTTDRGDRFRTRVLMRSNGALTKPQLPKVPGIGDFEGKIFHTSRWDYDYTGGTAAGNLENLRDKRVAVVGTGATGVQVVPYVAQDAEELVVVQRTPSVVQPRNNRKTDPDWKASLEPGWQYERHDNFNGIISGHEVEGNMVDDGWTHLFPELTGQPLVDVPVGELPVADQAAVAEIADMKLLMGAHARVDSIVADQATADGLKPWFGYMCKRPCFNDEYLQTFNRPNVTLAASPTGIDGITSTGIVVGGTHYEVDCIIFATGFETGSGPAGIYGYDVIGRDGHSMQEYFTEGARTFHGFFTHGFPNFVELGMSQTAYYVNFVYMLDRKARHSARLVRHLLDNDLGTFEPTAEAEADWVTEVRRSNEPREAYWGACTPGYYNGQGEVSKAVFRDVYNSSEIDFWNMIEDWWNSGRFEGLALTPSRTASPVA